MKKLLYFLPLFLVMIAAQAFAEYNSGMPNQITTLGAAMTSPEHSLVVKGEGAAPSDRPLSPAQKRMLALRAAKLVAVRELAEIINGIPINGETTIKDMAVQSDSFRTTVQGFVNGAQVIKEAYDQSMEVAVVYVAMPVTGSTGVLGTLMPSALLSLPPSGPAYAPPAGAPAPSAPALKYDGLVIDVRDHLFKPALINRVLAKNGDIIYDPAKVAQNILVERGAAEYTNDVGKAKALLGERGAMNPLVVKASGVVKTTDAQVEPDDATGIYASNQASNYLEGAKVVFVLK